MKAEKLKRYSIIWIDERAVHVTGVEAQESGLTLLKGRPVRSNDVVEWVVASDDDLPLCTWDGILIESKTEAQIKAETVKQRAEAAGWTVELTMTEFDHMITARLWMTRGNADDSYSVSWYTRTKGRKTSGFMGGLKFRSYYRSKKVQGHVKISRKDFYSDLSSMCWRAERGF